LNSQRNQFYATAILALAAIWLLTHRYFGIQHDGLFYAVQALARITPGAYTNDIFFAFGSQDDYSLFSRPYAALIRSLGLADAALILLVAAQWAWALAAAAVARQWLEGRAFWLGLALIFALPGHYGSQAESAHDVLRYAETFLTARSWAEPLVLAAVAAALARRPGLAIAAAVLAALCHPIMALPGLIFLAACYLRPGFPTLVALAVLAAAAAFLLLPEMDGLWLGEVRRRARFVMLDSWTWGELLEPLAWIGILLAASAQAGDRQRAALRGLALAGAAGFYLAVLGTASHAALLIQAQPWRCLWLLKVTALLALVAMFAQRWRSSPADRWLLAALAAAALTAQTLGGPVALVLALLAHRAWRDGQAPALPRWLPAAAYLALAVTLLETLLAILQQLGVLAQRIGELLGGDSLMPRGDLAAFFQGPLALLLPAGFALLLCLHGRRPRLALAVAVLAAGVAAAGWYRTDDALQEYVYSTPQARPFGEAIGRNETVHWQGGLLYTWFVLRQSSYASREQGASALFSRPAAMESARRQDLVSAFDKANATPEAAVRAAGLRELCRDPALDVVILAQAIDGLAAASWFDPLRKAPWHLYRCAALRHGDAAPDRAGA
jgi:hypothetical protein